MKNSGAIRTRSSRRASCRGTPPPDRFAYLPFGVGARVCIGAHFALVEATLALAKMIGAFRVELLDKEPVMPVGGGDDAARSLADVSHRARADQGLAWQASAISFKMPA